MINLNQILDDVKLTLYDKINNSKAQISIEIDVPEIKFIKKNIRSIFYNLLSNAIKYKSPTRIPEIFIKTEKVRDYTLLTVTDNGIGIEGKGLELIFSKYSRVNHDIEGTGIGLYIISQMLENSGGKIEVESQIGKGTTFRIYFRV